jgi:hypothetical protein
MEEKGRRRVLQVNGRNGVGNAMLRNRHELTIASSVKGKNNPPFTSTSCAAALKIANNLYMPSV